MPENDCVSYQESGYFSRLIVDYLNQKNELDSLYNRFPKIENFELQIQEKGKNYSTDRTQLVSVLKNQNKNISTSDLTKANIESLKASNTFTITTGHQLNLFTGPIYFIYKIISTINLCRDLKLAYPDSNFVPIYWMATEDHDFDEINHFNLKEKKITWQKDTSGAVGKLSTAGLDLVYQAFEKEIGIGKNATYLKQLFQQAYLQHDTLTDASRYLVNELFKEHGLVIVDGDDSILKKEFAPFVEKELFENSSFNQVTETILKLNNYHAQVNPREINLFYCKDSIRERIVKTNNQFKVLNTAIEFTETEIREELEKHPQNFSPNVILRPLYQEVVLPNLCYIGGGGEIAYWLELQSNFEANKITFPILLIRNSVLLAKLKQQEKKAKLQLSWNDLFNKQTELLNQKTVEFSTVNFDFSAQKKFLSQQFESLKHLANQTDSSFEKAVKAQEVKQMKGLENLEKKLLKAERKKHQDQLMRIASLQDELFPNQSLQERKVNFSSFYAEYGDLLFEKLFAKLNPLDNHFTTIVL